MDPQNAQCHHCLKTVRVRKDGSLPLHGPKRSHCGGSDASITGWRVADTPGGPLWVRDKYRP